MTDYSDLIAQAEQKYSLPPGILAATAKVESSGNPRAVSPQGAQGVMQLMPATAASLGVNPRDPAQAIDGAGRLWQQNLQATNGDIDRAAMLYHGGPDTSKWGPKTQAYPGKLAAALGPAPQTQGGGDPIEAALTGAPQQAPSQAPPPQAGPQGDPIESALSSPPVDNNAIISQASQLLHAGKEQEAITLLGQHGIGLKPGELDAFHAGKRASNFNPPADQSAPPAAPQTDQGLGFYQGVMKPFDNAATWLKEGADKLGIGQTIDSLGSDLGLPSLQDANAGHQQYIQGQEAQGHTPGRLGKFGGEVAGTLPAVLATKNPWIAGGLSGALTTDDPNNLKQTAIDTGIGALGGKVMDTIVGGLSRAIAPKIKATVQALHDLGASMTPGTIVGGAMKRIEDGIAGYPVVGDLVKNAQSRSALSLNTATLQSRVLDPLGKTLPNGMVGREAIEYADTAAGDAYNELLPRLSIKADRPFVDNVGSILKTADELPPDRADQVQKILNGSFLSRFNQPGITMTGDTFKEADSKLGQLAREYSGSPDPEQRKMGGIFRDVQGELRGMLERQNPDHAAELKTINGAFANLVRIEGAAASAGAKGGVWSPSQLAASVRRFDTSPRKKAYSMGKALLQDVSDPANEIMPPSVPDSGTAFRTIGAYLLGGGLSHMSPMAAPAVVPMALYTKAGQQAFQRILLAPRGPGAKALAKALTKLKAPLAVAGGSAAAEATDGR